MKMISLFAVGLLITTFRAPAEAKTFNFAGYNWMVKSGSHLGPGPNNWDEDNVWVDQHDYLHLAITNRGGQWYCSQVSMVDRLGFGRYQFWIIGRVDQLDPNVVFGLFNYPTPDVGSDATREIDIEFAEWGKPNTPIGNYHSVACKSGVQPRLQAFLDEAKRWIYDAPLHLASDQRQVSIDIRPPQRRPWPVCGLAIPAEPPPGLHRRPTPARSNQSMAVQRQATRKSPTRRANRPLV